MSVFLERRCKAEDPRSGTPRKNARLLGGLTWPSRRRSLGSRCNALASRGRAPRARASASWPANRRPRPASNAAVRWPGAASLVVPEVGWSLRRLRENRGLKTAYTQTDIWRKRPNQPISSLRWGIPLISLHHRRGDLGKNITPVVRTAKSASKPESTDSGRQVGELKRQEGAPLNLG